MSNTTNHTPVSPISATSSLSVRILCEYNNQSEDYHAADKDMRYMSDTRTRHHALVNATRTFQDTTDVIAFYSKRYGVPATAPAPYTVADALADIRAAKLPHYMERVITKSAKTRPEVMAAIDAYRDDKAAQQARHTARVATLARY